MLITTLAPHEDGRPAMIIGLTVDDMKAILDEDGKIYLNRDEPDDSPLPAHIVIMLGDSEDDIAERIEKTLTGGAANEDA